ncbi:hypothetical protein BDA99DRAFT_280390 [Phascolomyces articulosus]|uniref:RhoGAP-domain-containing protein n=1 Tax=Phascolomyces articulosus TaxID=60185 RepID=A0AAD5KJV1_9FUNG|nr:hypothetical protein BDA99DRAFT_280390 [Phascolomyces articulosus]
MASMNEQHQHQHQQQSPQQQSQQPPVCIGCRNFIEEGSVIAFGDALFHLDCFTCAKCALPVDCNSKLLLLTDGRPVCENCSYVCAVCNTAIRDEAVMTGDEAYHANCFRCVLCKKKIDDLVFTQTSKGIYCTSCHEQRKAERQRRREDREKRNRSKSPTSPNNKSTMAPSLPPQMSSRTSRLLDADLASDYMRLQQALARPNGTNNPSPEVRSSSSTSTPRTSHDRPPTPSRSRSSSVDTSSTAGNSNRPMPPSRNPPATPPRTSSSRVNSPPATSSSNFTNNNNNKKRLSSIPSANSSVDSLPQVTPSTSSNNIYLLDDGSVSKGNLSVENNASLPTVPSLNLTFFDNDSSDLLNLTKSLGAGLSVSSSSASSSAMSAQHKKSGKHGKSSAVSKLTKATELLTSSLRHSPSHNNLSKYSTPSTTTSSTTWNDFPQPPNNIVKPSDSLLSVSSYDLDSDHIPTDRASVEKLRAELKAANNKVVELTNNLNKIKDASKQALDEFSHAKEDMSKESIVRQQHEYTILQLRQHINVLQQSNTTTQFAPLSNEEIERVAGIRVELERTCKELRTCRDTLSGDIATMAGKHGQAGLAAERAIDEHHSALLKEIKSLTTERDALKEESENLSRVRDEVINEMVILNTQNAELNTLNNDLSRRVTAREREAAAVMAGTSFLNPTASTSTESHSPSVPSMQRKSSETSMDIPSIASRDSFNGTQAPKLFKMKKSPFNRFGGGSNGMKSSKTDPALSTSAESNSGPYSLSNASVSSQSLVDYSRREARQGSKQSQASVQGAHSFQPTAFLRPVKCSVCYEKMWGLSEYRCQGCGMASHGKCLSQVPGMCFASTASSLELTSPMDMDSPKALSMFGADLVAQAQQEGRDVPLIVEKCIEAVENRAMDYEGIYRKSGGATQMRTIQISFDQGNPIDLNDDDEINDICAVTSVLKHYFRQLPNPLLTYEQYANFINAVCKSFQNHRVVYFCMVNDYLFFNSVFPHLVVIALPLGPEKTDKFIELLSQVPKANYDTLKMLIQHLQRVSQRSQENLMTVKNLSLVFAPTLMRDRDSTRDFMDMSYTNATMEFLITNAHEVFIEACT